MNKMHPKTKNEKKFEQWLLQQYGMTKKEQRGYTLEGNLDSLWEIFSAADMVLLVKALPNIGKNLVQLGKDVLENGIQFDTSLGIVAGGGRRRQLKNVGDDALKNSKALKERIEYKKPVSGKSAKEAAKDVPSWAKGNKPYKNESGNDFAKRLLDEKYGKGNYPKGPGTEYNQIRKWGDRGFE